MDNNEVDGQYYFIPPNILQKIEDGNDYEPINIEQLDKYNQDNNWTKIDNKIDQIQIKLTNKCNYSCIHCLENASPYNKEFINFKLLLPFLEEFKKHNNKGSVVLTGGEPLLHPHILFIINSITELNIPIILFTNGTLIAARKFDSYIKHFKKIHLSIDGFSEKINDNIRGKGAFKTLIKTLSILKEYDIPITLSCALFEYNINDIEQNLSDFIDKYYDENITLNFDYVRPIGRGKNIAPSYEKALEYITRIKKLLNYNATKIEIPKLDYCGYGRLITIESNGDFYACSHYKSLLGNYLSFSEVLQTIKKNLNFIENRLNKVCKKCILAWVCRGGCFLDSNNTCDLKRKNETLLKMKYGTV